MAFTLSIMSSGANDVVRAGVFKNGVLMPGSQIQLKLGQIGDVSSTAIHVMDAMNSGDTIQLHVLNENDNDDLTVTYANMVSVCMV